MAQMRLAGGLLLCLAIAELAHLAERFAPLVGAPLFAIAIGVVLTNTVRGPLRLATWRVGDVSRLCLKGGIILLGASLDIGQIVRTGLGSLPLLLVTMVVGLGTRAGRRPAARRALAHALPDRHGHHDLRRLGDRRAGPGDPRQGRGDRLRHHRDLLLQHAGGVFVSADRPAARAERRRLRPVGRHRGERHLGRGGGRLRLQPGGRHHRHHRQADPHDADHPAGDRLRPGDAVARPGRRRAARCRWRGGSIRRCRSSSCCSCWPRC